VPGRPQVVDRNAATTFFNPSLGSNSTQGGYMSQHANEVRLVGRLGATVDERSLPSGTVLTNFSIVVDRPAREVHGRTKVDTIACQTTRSSVAARLGKVDSGQTVEVFGALRRRFWKSAAGLASATEVDVVRMTAIREVS